MNESQAKAIKLASKEEWNTERFPVQDSPKKLKKLKLEVSDLLVKNFNYESKV